MARGSPRKIAVLFTIEAENAGEFFRVIELYKKCIETKNRMSCEESSAISGEIYRKMLEQCKEHSLVTTRETKV